MILVKYLDTMIIHCSLGFQQINLIQPYHPKASIFPPAHGAVDIPNSHPHRLLLSLKKMSSCSMEIMGQLSFNSIANIIIYFSKGKYIEEYMVENMRPQKKNRAACLRFLGGDMLLSLEKQIVFVTNPKT